MALIIFLLVVVAVFFCHFMATGGFNYPPSPNDDLKRRK